MCSDFVILHNVRINLIEIFVQLNKISNSFIGHYNAQQLQKKKIFFELNFFKLTSF